MRTMKVAENQYYSATDAARLAQVSASQVRRWTSGAAVPGLTLWGARRPALYSFHDVVEMALVGRLRDRGIRLEKIRRCMGELGRRWATPRPFATRSALLKLKTCGAELMIDEDGALEDLDRRQFAFRKVVEPHLVALEFERNGEQAIRWWPNGLDGAIAIDPAVGFGRPLLFEYRVPTDVLRMGVDAGDSIEEVADAFEVPVRAVRAALEFEEGLRTAA